MRVREQEVYVGISVWELEDSQSLWLPVLSAGGYFTSTGTFLSEISINGSLKICLVQQDTFFTVLGNFKSFFFPFLLEIKLIPSGRSCSFHQSCHRARRKWYMVFVSVCTPAKPAPWFPAGLEMQMPPGKKKWRSFLRHGPSRELANWALSIPFTVLWSIQEVAPALQKENLKIYPTPGAFLPTLNPQCCRVWLKRCK